MENSTSPRLNPRNVAILLCCTGPVVTLVSAEVAYWFAHSPTGEPTEAKAEFYVEAATYCVTGVMAGVILFLVGLCMSSYLLLCRFVLRKKQ